MAIKSISENSVVYTPDFADNRLSEKPLKVVLKPLSRGQADRYAKQVKYYQKKGSRNGEWDSNALEVQKKQFMENVLEVHNFIDCDTGDEIKEISRFYHDAPFPLIEEILNILLDVSQLDEDERKN